MIPFSHPHFKQLHERLNLAPNREERLKILQQTQKSAREEFPIQFDKLENLLLNYNPYVILELFHFAISLICRRRVADGMMANLS